MDSKVQLLGGRAARVKLDFSVVLKNKLRGRDLVWTELKSPTSGGGEAREKLDFSVVFRRG